jgi:branched-chain amino acid transport system permease protein
MAGLEFVVMRTRFGRAMRAVSFDAPAAALMGVPVDRVIQGTFMLGSALAAAAGVLVGLSNPKIDPLMGLLPGLKAFVAAVLGGIGSIPGAMLGGLLLGVVETFVAGYLSSTYRDAIAFVVLVVILLYRPTGILGAPQLEKV